MPGRAGQSARKPLLLVPLAGLSLLLGGCLTGPREFVQNGFKVGPNYHEPAAPTLPTWIQPNDPRLQDRIAPDGDWWTVFEDPALNELVDAAYKQNLNLRSIAARVFEARAQRGIVFGSLFPQTQQAYAQYSRVNLSHNAPNNPSAIQSIVPIAIPPGVPFGNTYSDWQGGFNMSWEIDFWGKARRGIEGATANLEASVDNYDAAVVSLLGDIATNYVQYRVAQQRIAIARDNVRVQETLVKLAEQQFKVGTIDKLGVAQLRTVLEQTRSTIPALEIVRGQANDTLCVLLGVPMQDLEGKFGPGPGVNDELLPNIPTWVAAGIPADLLRRRPDVRSAERQVAAQSAQIGVAEADLYPTIFVNGTLGYEATNLSQLFESRSFFGNITPNFKWNILNYGRIKNNVRLQEAHTQELIATYQNQVLTAAQQVQTALRGFLRSQEQVTSLVATVTAATEASDLGRKQYLETGKTDLNRLFNLETARVQQQDSLAVARGNIALNLISTYRAMGGGWEWRRLQAERAAACAALGGIVPAAER